MKTINFRASISFLELFRTWNVMDIAKHVGFVKRRDGKLSPLTFVKALTLGITNLPDVTLEQIARKCEDLQTGLTISKEAIHQRLQAGVALMKEVFKLALAQAVRNAVQKESDLIHKHFKNIYICDSTFIPVPPKLNDCFKGPGGSVKTGTLKLQVMFNLLDRNLKKMEVTEWHGSDRPQTYEIAKELGKGDLAVFDAGFYNFKAFKEIDTKESFYLTRIAYNTVFSVEVAEEQNAIKRIHILDILKKSNGVVDAKVYLGCKSNEVVCCRLIAERVPDNVANERLRKAQRRYKAMNKLRKELYKWNILVTNVFDETVTVKSLFSIYKNRWQIEILFKAFKSHIGLEKLGEGGKDKIECVFYGRLISAILMITAYSEFYSVIYRNYGRELSVLRFFSNLKGQIHSIIKSLDQRKESKEKLEAIFIKVAKKSIYEKRKRQSSLCQLLHSLRLSLILCK